MIRSSVRYMICSRQSSVSCHFRNHKYACCSATARSCFASSSLLSNHCREVLSQPKQQKNGVLKPARLSTTSSSSTPSSTLSTSSSTSTDRPLDDDKPLTPTKGLLSLLTHDQRLLLQEQRKISKAAIRLAQQVGGDIETISSSLLFDHTSFLQQIVTPHNDTTNTAKQTRVDSNHVLDSTFSIVVAGEFNAGKSTLINALLGKRLLETGALPTTDSITVLTSNQSLMQSTSTTSSDGDYDDAITHDKNDITTSHSNAITLHRIPNIPLLQDLTFIDTPGTNAIIANHTSRTLKLLPTADLILFVTSADRPFPESERQLLQSIQAYRKNIVIVINKMDILDASGGNHGSIEKERVFNFVKENAADLLGVNAVILTVSANDALSAKLVHGSSGSGMSATSVSGNSEKEKRIESSKMWKRSGFDALESFLRDSLTDETKIQAKLLNPLGVTDGILTECMNMLERRGKELKTDVATVNLLQNQMNAWRRDMDSDIEHFQNDIRDHMKKELDRCSSLVDSIGVLEKYSLFLFDNGKELETKWENTKSIILSDDVEIEVLNSVRESTDTIATSARAQGQAVIEYLGKRPSVVGQNLIGSVTAASRFEDTRKDLNEKMSQAVESVFSNYTSDDDKKTVFDAMKNTVYLSTVLNILSIGSGVTIMMEMVDFISGGLACVGFGALGAGIVPQRNRNMTKQFELQWEKRNKKLGTALDALCSKEVDRIHKRILDGVAPYSRYVASEKEDVQKLSEECNKLSEGSQVLRNRIKNSR